MALAVICCAAHPLRSETDGAAAGAAQPRVALVLSGGGARGIAHIGAIRALEEAGVPVDLIVGTSIGAVVGGLYAAGYTADEMARIGRGIDWAGIYSDAPARRNLFVSRSRALEGHFLYLEMDGLRPVLPAGFSRGQHLCGILNDLFVRAPYHVIRDFDNLRIPFRAVATDLVTGRRVVMSRGELPEVIRASMAVPLFFTPVEMDGMLLVDGGLVDCIPTDVAREAGAGIVIAVTMSGLLRPPDRIGQPLGIADQMLSIMKKIPNSLRLRDADVVIAPPVAEFLPGDFGNFDSLVAAGYRAGAAALPRIRVLLDSLGISAGPPEQSGAAVPLRHLTFGGNTLFSDSVLLAAAGLPAGGGDPVRTAFERIRRLYLEQGYTAVRIVPEKASGAGDSLRVTVDEGAIGQVSIQGAVTVTPHVVLREMPLAPGMIFHAGLARQGADNIFATGLFDQVRFDLAYHPDTLELVIRVHEKQPVSLGVGLRYDLEGQAAGQLTLGHHNLFGMAYGLSLGLVQGKFRNRVRLKLHADRILNSYFSSETGLYYRHRELTYTDGGEERVLRTQRWGADLYVGTQIRRFGNASLGVFWHRQQDIRIWAASDRTGSDETKGIRLRSFTDTFDRALFPVSGRRQSFNLEAGQSTDAPDLLYVKAAYRYTFVRALARRAVLSPRFVLAAADANTPFTERMFTGGITADGFRDPFTGYRGGELWGRNMLLAGSDLRLSLLENIYCILRLTGGYISNDVDFIGREVVFDWEQFRTTFTSSLYYGIGAGLAAGTPLGPLELWYGYGDRSRDTRGRIYLNMGFDF